MLDDYTPTVHASNVSMGMVLQFGGVLVEAANGMSLPLWAAEVTYVEAPDGLGDSYGFYVKPEDAEEGPDLYVTAKDWKEYPIVG